MAFDDQNDPYFSRGRSPQLPLPTRQVNANDALNPQRDKDYAYVSEPQKYPNLTVINQALVANAPTRILLAPDYRRVYLLVINTDATFDIWLNFFSQAAVGVGLPLSANRGSLLMDAVVSQDDVWLFSLGAATFSLTYGNLQDFGRV